MRHTFECEGGKRQMGATDAEIDSPKASKLVSEDGMPTMTGECANQGNGTRTPRAVNGQSSSKRDNGSPGRETHHRRTRSRPTLPASTGPSPDQQSSHEEERERSVQEGVPGDISPDMLYKHLIDRFPARNSEIKQLLGFFGEQTDLMLPLFIYGGASTGKTSIILNALRMMNRPFAYASCRSSHTPRILFESILNQLTKHTRSSSNNFGSSKKCDKLSDFLGLLCDACHAAALEKAGAISKGSTCPLKKSGTEKVDVDKFPKPVIYLIFDNVDLLLDWSGGLRLISALMRLSEFTGMENLGLIFISSLGPDAFFSGTGMLEPIPIYMRDYTDDDLYQILLKKKPKGELYSSFLSIEAFQPCDQACYRAFGGS
ncbi:hypothetical protein KP509_01G111600 [Ceratopteris richardii]|uniref:Orc1-like AAA ATPase domain-containing protein n=1 Tax=Ceratopteris richardii TaxID=49495 RepID=A0A8T2VN26_CERRI|nr:hypothetical protein KP509_01G111600 [Ceratopteris richardii]